MFTTQLPLRATFVADRAHCGVGKRSSRGVRPACSYDTGARQVWSGERIAQLGTEAQKEGAVLASWQDGIDRGGQMVSEAAQLGQEYSTKLQSEGMPMLRQDATYAATTIASWVDKLEVDAMTAWQMETIAAKIDNMPVGISLLVLTTAGLTVGGLLGFANRKGPELPTTYDLRGIQEYWQSRPIAALKRSSGLLAKLVQWGIRVLLDIREGDAVYDANMPKRAAEMRDIISDQGPAFVKVGQAVAIRPDLLPEPYLKELQQLLDQVQAFSSDLAKETLRTELGRPLEELFLDVSVFDAPIAAASIGQVYRAQLKDGSPVAVKVQRPDILETVTLDIITIRGIAEAIKSLPGDNDRILQARQNAEGFLAVLDVAAARFLEELDYLQEAENGARFEAKMGAVEVVRGIVKIPKVYLEFSSRSVIVQEWVEGRKLTELQEDTSAESVALKKDVVTKLLNSYMVQFLETGFLHADPHPGNFTLMEDGRLCIMDYGMMTEISPTQRVAFVEYLAHLSAGQYNETLSDLVALGFVPPELEADPEKRALVAPVLAQTLETLYSTGGGVDKKLDALQTQQNSRIGEISDQLEQLALEYPIQLPPYFVLILRAFGTLEGLGLSVDGDFAIVDECFPYIARRLLSDDSPRMQSALKTFLYGKSQRINVQRLEDLTNGFVSFTNNMDASEAAGLVQQTPELDSASRDLLALLFSPEGNLVQDLMIEEGVRAVDSLSRDAVFQVWKSLGAAAPFAAAASFAPVGPFGSPLALVPGLNTFPLISLIAAQNTTAIDLSYDDKRNLAVIRRLTSIFIAGTRAAPSTQPEMLTRDQVQQLTVAFQVASPGVQRMAAKFSEKLMQRFQERMQADFSRAGLLV